MKIETTLTKRFH